MKIERYVRTVRNRDLVLLVAGRSVSWYGNALAPMAMVFAVLDLGRSVNAVSLVIVARSVPQLVFILFGGVIADRSHRRQVLIIASIVAALSQGALACLLGLGHAGIATMVGLSMINGTAAALSGPAAGAIFRAVVPAEDWPAASVLDRGGMQLALLLGLSTGGLLIGVFGPATAIGVDAATFGVAGLCYALLRDPGNSATARSCFIQQLAAGFGYLRRRNWLIVITAQTLITGIAFAAGLQVLAPVVADATFGRTALGVAGSFQVAGALVGVLLAGVLPARGRLTRVIMMGGAVAVPLALLAFGSAIPVPVLVIMFALSMLVTGCSGELSGIWQNLATLRHVDPEMIGRAGSFGLLASVGGLSVGEALAGPLHGLLGTRGAYFSLIGLVSLIVIIGIASPSVRSLDYGSAEDRAAT